MDCRPAHYVLAGKNIRHSRHVFTKIRNRTAFVTFPWDFVGGEKWLSHLNICLALWKMCLVILVYIWRSKNVAQYCAELCSWKKNHCFSVCRTAKGDSKRFSVENVVSPLLYKLWRQCQLCSPVYDQVKTVQRHIACCGSFSRNFAIDLCVIFPLQSVPIHWL